MYLPLREKLAVAALLCVTYFRTAVAESEPIGWYYHDNFAIVFQGVSAK